jgi:hypothetical protein
MAEATVHSVYCERSDQIVALDGSFCRACRTQVKEGDGRHTKVTSEVLERLGYVSTPHAECTAGRDLTARQKEGEAS